MTTAELTKQIMEYCRLQGHLVVRVNNIPMKKYMRSNTLKGTPDLMGATKKGVALAIEIKNEDTKDHQSEYQKEFEAHYQKRGGIYIVAKKLEDVTNKI